MSFFFSLGMSKKANSIALAPVLQIQCTLGWGELLITMFSYHLGYCWHLLGSYQAIVGYLLSLLTNSPQKLLIYTMMKSLGGLNCEFFVLFFAFFRTLLKYHQWRIFAKYLRTNLRFIIDSRIQKGKESKQNSVFWGEAFVAFFVLLLYQVLLLSVAQLHKVMYCLIVSYYFRKEVLNMNFPKTGIL